MNYKSNSLGARGGSGLWISTFSDPQFGARSLKSHVTIDTFSKELLFWMICGSYWMGVIGSIGSPVAHIISLNNGLFGGWLLDYNKWYVIHNLFMFSCRALKQVQLCIYLSQMVKFRPKDKPDLTVKHSQHYKLDKTLPQRILYIIINLNQP